MPEPSRSVSSRRVHSSSGSFALMISPPSNPISTRESAMPAPLVRRLHQLHQHALHAVWVDERHPQPEEADPRRGVDQLGSGIGRSAKRRADVVHPQGDVVHPRPAVGEELSHRRIGAERPKQLDAAAAEQDRGRLDALLWHRLPVLERAAEQLAVGSDGGIEVLHGVPDMMDLLRAHCARILVGNVFGGYSMGFLDKIKQQATDVATSVVEKTQETAKTGQLQMQLRSLKNEEKEALADLGAAMIALRETPNSLADQTTKVHELRDRIAEKEQEIADVRAESAADTSSETVESEAEEVVDTPPAAADGAAPDDTPA